MADQTADCQPNPRKGATRRNDLLLHLAMNAFIFQSVVERYDLRRELSPNKSDTWYATRYRNEMNPGDTVFFWMGGDATARGLYGWGVLTSRAYVKNEWDSHGVDVLYRVRFGEPVLATELKRDPVLHDLLVLRAPQATNFLLTKDQATQLSERLRMRGEKAPTFEGAK